MHIVYYTAHLIALALSLLCKTLVSYFLKPTIFQIVSILIHLPEYLKTLATILPQQARYLTIQVNFLTLIYHIAGLRSYFPRLLNRKKSYLYLKGTVSPLSTKIISSIFSVDRMQIMRAIALKSISNCDHESTVLLQIVKRRKYGQV